MSWKITCRFYSVDIATLNDGSQLSPRIHLLSDGDLNETVHLKLTHLHNVASGH